jgi:hypothetical protein
LFGKKGSLSSQNTVLRFLEIFPRGRLYWKF